jgi:hypothetical protein
MKVFISHSSVDKEFVRTLKRDLNANGILTWVDEDQITIGDSLTEKLDSGLTQSSHFIIVLSQASVNSDWVKYEIQKALVNKKIKLLNKIIPIKYNECEIPSEFSDLLYGDLSNETRVIKNDYVEFVSTEYIKVVDKLCKSIKKSEKQLTEREIIEIKVAIDKNEEELLQKSTKENIKGVYLVKGFKSKESRLEYASTIAEGSPDIIKPILLPSLWKNHLNINKGDIITISTNYLYNDLAHFAGFRNDDTSIVIDSRIRKGLSLITGKTYLIEFIISARKLILIPK